MKRGIEVYEIQSQNKEIELKIIESDFGGSGWLEIKRNEDKIYISKYNIQNSPLHTLIGFPASVLISSQKNWTEIKRINKWMFEIVCADSSYDIDHKKTVTAYKTFYNLNSPYIRKYYCKRVIKWSQWLYYPLLIKSIEMDYEDKKKDKAILASVVSSRAKKVKKITYYWKCSQDPRQFNFINFINK